MKPVGKSARNEQRKLFATSVNAVGLTVFAVAGLTPAVTRAPSVGGVTVFLGFGLVATMLHFLAQAVLRDLED